MPENAETRSAIEASPAAPPKKKRVESIDAFRGMTIFVMVFVIAVAAGDYRDLPQKGSWMGSLPVSTWNHADVAWERFVEEKKAEGLSEEQIEALPEARLKNVGCTITDLVAPFFVFVVGLCIPLSRSRRGAAWWRHVLARTFLLILAGVFYISLILGLSWWWGILQAIGVAYFMGAVMVKLSRAGRWVAIFAVLAFHLVMSEYVGWWLDFGKTSEPFWTVARIDGNLARPLTVHCLPWVSISYGAMTMIGVLLGEAILSRDRGRITRQALQLGLLFTLLGYGIHKIGLVTGHTSLCLNKPDVTASYALFTSGIGCLTFLVFFYVIDVWGYRRWAFPLNAIGANALLAYFMQVIMRLFFRALRVEDFFSGRPNETLIQWSHLSSSPLWEAFLLDKTGYNGMLWGLIWTVCLWVIIYGCNKRSIYWNL